MHNLAALLLSITLLPNPVSLLLSPPRVFAQATHLSQVLDPARGFGQPVQMAQASDSRQAEVQQLFGQGVNQYKVGQYEAMFRLWDQALKLSREIRYRKGEMLVLLGFGAFYADNGNYAKAIDYQQQSLVILRELKDVEGEIATLLFLAKLHSALGDYPKAINNLQQNLGLVKTLENRKVSSLLEALILTEMGNTYKSFGDYLKAIDYLQQSVRIFHEQKAKDGEGMALRELGDGYRRLGDHSKAIDSLQQSLEIFRKRETRGENEGITLRYLGDVYRWMGNYTNAIDFYQQSLVINRERKDRVGESISLFKLGNVYDDLKEYPKAIDFYQQGLVIDRERKDREDEGTSYHSLGLTLFKVGNLTEAEAQLRKAIDIRESLRQGLQDSQKVSLADTQRNSYNILQQVLLAQNKVESALEVAERSRARAFAELLAKRTQGKAQITVQPIPIASIKQIAKEQNAALVQYANIYNEQLLIYVIKPTGEVALRQVDLKPLKQQKISLDNLITAIRCWGDEDCEQRVASRGDKPFAFNTAQADRQFVPPRNVTLKNKYLQQLHSLLIDPIADLLPKNPDERVIFMPQGQLFLVPFAALQDKQGQSLIDRHTIAYAPSIQVLQLTRQQRQRLGTAKQGNMLLVGNPVMPSLIFNPANPPAQLPPLLGAEKEVKAISEMLKVPALIGKQATKAVVMKQMSSARIIHLATHGLLDDFGGGGVPGAIALAPDKPGEVNNGLLTSNELLDMKLNAELVVLSACDTGRGKITGDGVIGLSRSLITAGVPSVIVSLWAVPDAPTADLMTRFYQNLNQGQDKAAALRQAMLATKKDHPDPTAWAAFVLIGEAQ